MSELKFIKFEKTNGVARITLARPKHNVMNMDMMNELNSVLEALGSDDELKCLVFLGEGKSWCAGVEVGDHKPEMAPGMIAVFDRIFELIRPVGRTHHCSGSWRLPGRRHGGCHSL